MTEPIKPADLELPDSEITPEMRADLDLIKSVLPEDEQHDVGAIYRAVRIVGEMIRTGALPMTQADLEASMLNYASHAVSVALQRPVALEQVSGAGERGGFRIVDIPPETGKSSAIH